MQWCKVQAWYKCLFIQNYKKMDCICYPVIESLDSSLVTEIIVKIRRRPFCTHKKRNVRKVNDEMASL